MPRRRSHALPPVELRKDLRRAWLLLLLKHEPTHGYALHCDLRARGLNADPGAVYRTLRQLDAEGLIASRWTDAPQGPKRRVYAITRAGHKELDETASALTRTRDAQSTFLRAYRKARVPAPRANGSADRNGRVPQPD